jgi:hypothetical protein
VILAGLALLLGVAAVAAASTWTFKGKGIDDEKVTVLFDLHSGHNDGHRTFFIHDIEARNAKCTSANGYSYRGDYSFGLLEPIKVDGDGEFNARYRSDFELYHFKGQFPHWHDGNGGVLLDVAKGLFKVSVSEGGIETGCTTGRVDWKAHSAG